VKQLVFADSAGLEACVYDSVSKNFLVNNDGTTANPLGELDVITASSVTAGTPVVSNVFPLGKCAPFGLVLGPNSDVFVACGPPAGNPLISLILDRNTGKTLATLPFGGGDQVDYDPASKRYFFPSRKMTANGTAAASGFLPPEMGVIDAVSRTLLGTVPVGSGVHSVAVDSSVSPSQVYVPYAAGTAGFPDAGISVFATQ
jgi:hypothetical protein